MGMFDYLICEFPISAPATVKEWQTKDTPAQFLEDYKIASSGHLMFHEKEREWVEDKDRPFLGGYLKTISSCWKMMPTFRGEIIFYGHETIDGKDCYDKWWEYSALFDNGMLIDLKPIQEGSEQ